jgi:hypothetical protein
MKKRAGGKPSPNPHALLQNQQFAVTWMAPRFQINLARPLFLHQRPYGLAVNG